MPRLSSLDQLDDELNTKVIIIADLSRNDANHPIDFVQVFHDRPYQLEYSTSVRQSMMAKLINGYLDGVVVENQHAELEIKVLVFV